MSKTFLVECVRSGGASCNKRREFWHETHTPLWLLIGRINFLTCEKTSFAILIWRIIFFTCEWTCRKCCLRKLGRWQPEKYHPNIVFAWFWVRHHCSFLERFPGIHISLSTLKRRLRDYGLKRRNSAGLNQNEVRKIIREELDGPSCMSGYRAMWHTLRLKYGLCIPRSVVQSLLKELDPVGTEERRKHRLKRRTYSSSRPNECWHVDGYDKLKPFGFPIHGAVDGYSRTALWLKVTPSNNNPSIVGNFFLYCVSELQGCPKLLRTDPGTENVVTATMQCLLRANGNGEFTGEKVHRYGPSTGNQRVECWWSHLKKSRTTWWINFFKDLVDRGVFLLNETSQKMDTTINVFLEKTIIKI